MKHRWLCLFFPVLKKKTPQIDLKNCLLFLSMVKRDRRQLSIFFTLGDLRDFARFHDQSPMQTICASTTVTLHTTDH